MGKIIKVVFIAFFIGVFCGSCIMSSNITLLSSSSLQSPRDNEAGTFKKGVAKDNSLDAPYEESGNFQENDMNNKGILPWLFDKTLGGGK